MTRPLFLALLLLLPLHLLAEEPQHEYIETGVWQAPPVLTAEFDLPHSNSDWLDVERPVPNRAISPAASVLFEDVLASDQESQDPAGGSDLPSPMVDGSEDCFHDAILFDCRLEHLDPTCYCGTTCCTTDVWTCNPCQCSHGNCYQTGDGNWVCDDSFCDVSGDPYVPFQSAFRFGWWGISHDGSLVKTGEFQDLKSSPFWDVDMVSSDGTHTLDFWLSSLDNEANNAFARYYGPGLTAKFRYNRFLRRLDHDLLTGADVNGPIAPLDDVVHEDLNVGENYAIRVQTLDASFQGNLSNNVKWRLNLWGMRKFGERQANATAHCFNMGGGIGNRCHILSQRQSIDWTTLEIEPVVEARWRNLTVQYARTMRAFGQSDQVVDRTYTRFAPFNNGAPYEYAFVPENFTQIDRLKLSAPVGQNSDAYAYLYHGDTHNEFRDTHRRFWGFDVRLTSRPMDGLTMTGYAKMDKQSNQFPPFLLPEETNPANVRHPIDRTRTRAGLTGRWQPYRDSYGGDSWVGGYQYYLINREFSTFDTALGPFTQPDTVNHQIHLGPSHRWSPTLDTFVRYRGQFSQYPLIGVREANGAFNTNQPQQAHGADIGGTWTPAPNFVTTAQFGLMNSWHASQFANFRETSYPIAVTTWYAPTEVFSITGGYFYYSNWIDQDVTLGFRGPDRTETTEWGYSGDNHIISLSASYLLQSNVRLTGGWEWDRGVNIINVAPSTALTPADWSLIPYFSDVNVITQRYTAGIDWEPYADMNVYLRYNFFDYDNLAGTIDSGTAHMALAGVSFLR